MLKELEALVAAARREIPLASSRDAAEALRVRYLGKKGDLSALLRGMGSVPAADRPAVGAAVNTAKEEIERLLAHALSAGERAALEAELSAPPLDVTLPGRRKAMRGHRHPVSQAMEDIVGIFSRMGYEIAEGPEVELDHYNFASLNMPTNHPARDMQDTFYVDMAGAGGAAPPSPALLRTHTSPVQIRTMLGRQPPLRICSPGKVYRRDDDPTHSPMFHQVEGLCVDQGITFGDLKGTLNAFIHAFFGSASRTRFRPSYFPFVEPGAEVDVACARCRQPDGTRKGCNVCKHTGWVEILGCGMIHPVVFEACGIDPEAWTGFALGMGIERMAMVRYDLPDLRLFFDNDPRFLAQF